MRFSLLALVAAVPAMVAAKNITVLVGKGGSTFAPNSIAADVGDLVWFSFEGGNHTVTQSTFDDPCTQPFNTTSGVAGFDSGFMPATDNSTVNGTSHAWVLEIKSTKPLWFFCARAGHCQGGMAGAINPPASGNTIDAFVAKLATAQVTPYGTTKPLPTSSGAFKTAGMSASAIAGAMVMTLLL